MIENNQVVSIEYEVKENGTDSVLDSNIGGKPLEFIMGAGEIIKGLEEAIAQMSVGDKQEVIVAQPMLMASIFLIMSKKFQETNLLGLICNKE